jgi:hypothetical protein
LNEIHFVFAQNGQPVLRKDDKKALAHVGKLNVPFIALPPFIKLACRLAVLA